MVTNSRNSKWWEIPLSTFIQNCMMRPVSGDELKEQEKLYFSELYHLEKVTSFDKLLSLSYNNYATVPSTATVPGVQT
jgi:hypothetical protein